jgi:glucose-6-phosphate isomerase, archaeal
MYLTINTYIYTHRQIFKLKITNTEMGDIIDIIKKKGEISKTFLSDMEPFFKDKDEVNKLLKKKNPLIYEVHFITEDEISYAITIINPGKVGKERYMTKGHYHLKSTSEVYYKISGEGYILIRKGKEKRKIKLEKNKFHYIPKDFAHRTVNNSNKKLVFLSIYQTDSGHDYERIKKEGF